MESAESVDPGLDAARLETARVSERHDAYSLHMTINESVLEASEPLHDYFVRLFEYDHWANRFVMEAMATISDLVMRFTSICSVSVRQRYSPIQ